MIASVCKVSVKPSSKQRLFKLIAQVTFEISSMQGIQIDLAIHGRIGRSTADVETEQ